MMLAMGNNHLRCRPWRQIICVVSAFLLFRGCITPPAILEAGWDDIDLLDFPSGSERVELVVDDERTLAGVFVPAGDGAPVVMILPGALETVTLGCRHDVRVRFGPLPEASPDDPALINRMTMGALSVSTEGSFEQGLSARASVGWPAARMSQEVTFFSLAPKLTEELRGRDLTLTWELLNALRAQGLATLFVDYGGVGASSGERDADRLADDAWTIWCEAVARAGGRPGRVALRGTSLGTVAAATLLERGAQPAAVVLVAPVRGETVVEHFAHWTNAPWWQRLALPFVEAVTDADLVETLNEYTGWLRVYVPAADALLPADERALLLASCERERAGWAEHEQGHETLAIAGHDLLPGELDLYQRAFPDRDVSRPTVAEMLAVDGVTTTPLARAGSSARSRWETLRDTRRYPSAAILAALALDSDGLDRAATLQPWLDKLPDERLAHLDLQAARSLLDLDDPDGALDPAGPAALATLLAGPPGQSLVESVAALVERLDQAAEVMVSARFSLVDLETDIMGRLDKAPVFTVRFRRHGIRVVGPVELALFLTGQALLAETSADGPGLSLSAGRRRALRRLLKGLGVPDKLAADGTQQAFTHGGWGTIER